uniref:CRF domain-containing protein n=1 Tax=Panagrellus redivivus TaxID=6233 RepID=A0A7E4V2H9_PANRE
MTSLRLIVAFCLVVGIVAPPPAGGAGGAAGGNGELFESKSIQFDLPINSLIYTVDAEKLGIFLQSELASYIAQKAAQSNRRMIREAVRNGENPPRAKRYLIESTLSLTPVDNTSGEPIDAPVVPRLPRSEEEEAPVAQPAITPPSAPEDKKRIR